VNRERHDENGYVI